MLTKNFLHCFYVLNCVKMVKTGSSIKLNDSGANVKKDEYKL